MNVPLSSTRAIAASISGADRRELGGHVEERNLHPAHRITSATVGGCTSSSPARPDSSARTRASGCVARGHRVTGLDSFDGYLYPAEVEARERRGARAAPGFRLVEGDICDPAAVAGVITTDVDVVCHLAALAGVRPSLAEPLRYLRTNIEGTGVIIERMRALGLRAARVRVVELGVRREAGHARSPRFARTIRA